MHTLSSARRTCMASASAVECTATVAMPISLQARSTRSAISPRLAINTLSNIGAWRLRETLLYDGQRLPEFHGLAIADQDAGDDPCFGSRDVVHGFHRLDDQERLPLNDARADAHERRRTRLRRQIGGPDHGRAHAAWMLGGVALARRRVDLRRSRLWLQRGRRRHRRGVDAGQHLACHAHAHALAVDLNLGQAGLVEELSKLADQLVVHAGLALDLLSHDLNRSLVHRLRAHARATSTLRRAAACGPSQ